MRKAYQQTMRNELVAAVELLTRRKVIAFLSDNHIEPDIAIECFVLESRQVSDLDGQPDDGTNSHGQLPDA
jgi:hypothetical protein